MRHKASLFIMTTFRSGFVKNPKLLNFVSRKASFLARGNSAPGPPWVDTRLKLVARALSAFSFWVPESRPADVGSHDKIFHHLLTSSKFVTTLPSREDEERTRCAGMVLELLPVWWTRR
jgi:hypothetical protein